MSRLRVRVELNRGGVGVPLHKLASVVQESQRFFEMLAQDVHIDQNRGEWLGFDFDNESLNFTAEYVGPVTAEQVNAFTEAFDGVTSLRRGTIAQFTRIADAIGEDELIGFGLYPPDHEGEPEEWRCLSRRDALRIADEIQLLLGVSGEQDEETRLPSVMDTSAGARQFKERRDRALAAPEQKLPELVREVESNLSRRITRLEVEVDSHTHSIKDLRETTAATEDSFRGLLSAVENFCGQATRQLEKMTPGIASPPMELTPPALAKGATASPELTAPKLAPVAGSEKASKPVPVAAAETKPATAAAGEPGSKPAPVTAPMTSPQKPPPTPQTPPAVRSVDAPPLRVSPATPARTRPNAPSTEVPWRALGVAASIVIGIAAATFFWFTRTPEPRSAQAASGSPPAAIETAKPAESSQPDRTAAAAAPERTVPRSDSAATATPAPASVVPSEPAAPSAPNSDVMRVDLEARDLVWVTVTDVDGNTLIARTLQPNEKRTLELTKDAILRTGNAGGLVVRFNGQDVGPLGPSGKIRDVHFKSGNYKIVAVRDAS